MLRLASIYGLTVFVYASIAALVGLLIGPWVACMLAGIACGLGGCSLDFYGRWRSYKSARARLQAKEDVLRAMGIDIDALKAEALKAREAQPAPAQGVN